MIQISKKGRALSLTDLSNLESALHLSLPSEYKAFLLTTNGGIPTPNTIDITNLSGSPTDTQVFFGIEREIASSNIIWNYQNFLEGCLANEVVPIACDSFGDIFYIRCGKIDWGHILFGVRTQSDVEFFHVANDFGSLMEKIRA